MTEVTIFNDGKLLDHKVFAYRFQARTWLLLNGYLFDNGGVKIFDHLNNGNVAQLESRSI